MKRQIPMLILSAVGTLLVVSVFIPSARHWQEDASLYFDIIAVFAFFLEGLPAATERLRNFVDKAARATLAGGVFDDAATGQGLLNFFLRGLSCGALTEAEALATGLTVEELRSQSFAKIVAARHTSQDATEVVG